MQNQMTFPCYYPVLWLPPTIFHYNSAQILSTKEGIGDVIIIIPNISYDYLNQDQCAELFQTYLDGSPLANVTVQKCKETNGLLFVKELYKGNPQMEAYVALDEKTARSEEFNTVFAPNEHLEIQLVPSNWEKASKKMRDAIQEGDQQQFERYLPAHLAQNQKQDCWDIVHSEIQEQVQTKEYWSKVFEQIFSLK